MWYVKGNDVTRSCWFFISSARLSHSKGKQENYILFIGHVSFYILLLLRETLPAEYNLGKMSNGLE